MELKRQAKLNRNCTYYPSYNSKTSQQSPLKERQLATNYSRPQIFPKFRMNITYDDKPKQRNKLIHSSRKVIKPKYFFKLEEKRVRSSNTSTSRNSKAISKKMGLLILSKENKKFVDTPDLSKDEENIEKDVFPKKKVKNNSALNLKPKKKSNSTKVEKENNYDDIVNKYKTSMEKNIPSYRKENNLDENSQNHQNNTCPAEHECNKSIIEEKINQMKEIILQVMKKKKLEEPLSSKF